MKKRRPVLLASIVLAALAVLAALSPLAPWRETSAAGFAQDTLRITSITPSGTNVPPARQTVFQFNRRVVPVGRMERTADEVPISIHPPLPCEWRWINTSALACQLGEDDAFQPATRYDIAVRPEIESEDGLQLTQTVQHFFETERPMVTNSYFRTWTGPGTPNVRLTFNQRLKASAVAEHVFIRGERGERFALSAEPPDRELDKPERYWVVKPVTPLPLDQRVRLVVDAGLVSLEGPLPTDEEKQVVQFYTFPEHRFVGIQCYDNDRDKLDIPVGSIASEQGKCNPMRPVHLQFSSPVIKEMLRDHLIVEPDLAGGREDYEPWDKVYSYSRLRRARNGRVLYDNNLPELLKAETEYHLKASANEIRDEFGRPLAESIDFVFTTNMRPPNAVLTHPVATLESDIGTHVPLVATNLETVHIAGRTLTTEGVDDLRRSVPIPVARNVAFRFPLEVREWLGGRSGAILADLRATPVTSPYEPYRFFSQVTPFAVHVKLGHQNTLVWVTELATGEPVRDARVSLYRAAASNALEAAVTLTASVTDRTGVAYLDGASRLDPKRNVRSWNGITTRHGYEMFFVKVTKAEDIALVPLSYDFRLRPKGTNDTWIPYDTRERYGHVRTWGTTAQGVYRLGDTIQFKLYVRDQNNDTLIAAPDGKYHLGVYDPTDKLVDEVKDLELNAFGAYDGEVVVPENGAVGWYRFDLQSEHSELHWQPMRVLVADFTPAPFRVTTDLNGGRFRPESEVVVTTTASLHAGGPYADAQSRVTATLKSTPLRPKHPKAQGFRFGSSQTPQELKLHQSEEQVNAQGLLTTRFRFTETPMVRGTLMVESAVRDDRGKYVAGRATASYVGRDRFVGLHQKDWLLDQGEEAEVDVIVLDADEEPIAGVGVTLTFQYRETTAARVKGAGNAYLTQYNHTWVEAASCTETSQVDPIQCRFTPEKPGLYKVVASVGDTAGRLHESDLFRWARGKGQVLWEQPPGHQLPIEPEKSEYKVGDTARFLVRNPFPGAQALFSIERIGIQRQWTEVLEDATPVIEFEVTKDHIPGFYFSALVTSPRIDKPLGDGEIDLGKPAFRLGYVQVPVRDPHKEIEVQVRPERESYKPRETVQVSFDARPRHLDGAVMPEMELAVAVLDEAVFDLIGQGEGYFDPYEGFYKLDSLDVENFNLLTRLIGIQKFEKKGANAGGGGSRKAFQTA